MYKLKCLIHIQGLLKKLPNILNYTLIYKFSDVVFLDLLFMCVVETNLVMKFFDLKMVVKWRSYSIRNTVDFNGFSSHIENFSSTIIWFSLIIKRQKENQMAISTEVQGKYYWKVREWIGKVDRLSRSATKIKFGCFLNRPGTGCFFNRYS